MTRKRPKEVIWDRKAPPYTLQPKLIDHKNPSPILHCSPIPAGHRCGRREQQSHPENSEGVERGLNLMTHHPCASPGAREREAPGHLKFQPWGDLGVSKLEMKRTGSVYTKLRSSHGNGGQGHQGREQRSRARVRALLSACQLGGLPRPCQPDLLWWSTILWAEPILRAGEGQS